MRLSGRLDLEPRAFRHLGQGNLFGHLGKGPDVALGVERAIGARAIELVGRPLGDARAGRLRPHAVLVQAAVELDPDELGACAAQGGRTFEGRRTEEFFGGPFAAEADMALAEAHVGMTETAILSGDQQTRLEAEGLLEPLQRRHGIAIEDHRRERIGHDDSIARYPQYLMHIKTK